MAGSPRAHDAVVRWGDRVAEASESAGGVDAQCRSVWPGASVIR
jgi:hypothetical protein